MATALERYALLEAPGVWFDGRSARPHEVIVRFGEATLILLGPGDLPVAHWALASLRALPGQGAGMMVLVPDADSDERLTIGDPDMIAAIRAVCPELERPRAAPGTRRRLALWGAGAVAAVLAMVFLLIPMLAERLAPMIPPAREEALGRAVIGQLQQLLARTGAPAAECTDRAGRAALARLRGRLARHAPTHVPIRLTVLDHPMVNAVALPGGHVVLMRGLIEQATGPEELAGVIAHEIGHVMHRDPTRLALRAVGTAGLVGLLIGDLVGGTAVAALADALIRASYTREAEEAADTAAHRIMADAGLPLEPLADFFARIGVQRQRPTGFLAHLATHPDPAARAKAARAADRLAGAPFRPALSDNEWVALRGICEG
ncbi:MAG: peptidase M48 Ste24p [Alphaproteobacteria bacterium]|nr:MAG: peptidase M48 Ste24p [Alphaproteobacteria bacterium]